MKTPRIIRRDRGFSESYITIARDGFESMFEITVNIDWFDGYRKRHDPRFGRYPWVSVSWPSGTSNEDSPSFGPTVRAMMEANLIIGYVKNGMIRQNVVDIVPARQYKVGEIVELWNVINCEDEMDEAWQAAYYEMSFEEAAKIVINMNDRVGCNAGLKKLGGMTETEWSLVRAQEKRV